AQALFHFWPLGVVEDHGIMKDIPYPQTHAENILKVIETVLKKFRCGGDKDTFHLSPCFNLLLDGWPVATVHSSGIMEGNDKTFLWARAEPNTGYHSVLGLDINR